MAKLYGGSLQTAFADSMAEEIEKALGELHIETGLGPLPAADPENQPDSRNRRILFLAIARGVLRHFEKNPDAFEITVNIGNFDFPADLVIKVKP